MTLNDDDDDVLYSLIDGRRQCRDCHLSSRPRHVRRQLRCLVLTSSRTSAGRTRTGTVLSTGVHIMTTHVIGCGRTWTILSTDVHIVTTFGIEGG